MKSISIKTLYSIQYDTMPLTGIWRELIGEPEYGGFWIIYGNEKNGKTSFALMLADYLSTIQRTLYLSAEEGKRKTFTDACLRAGITEENKSLLVNEYQSISWLKNELKKRTTYWFVFIDNITVYVNELKENVLFDLMKDYPRTTFIFLAHEDKGDVYTPIGKDCARLATVIVRVVGKTAFISGRGVPGGHVVIDEEKAALIHGDEINQSII